MGVSIIRAGKELPSSQKDQTIIANFFSKSKSDFQAFLCTIIQAVYWTFWNWNMELKKSKMALLHGKKVQLHVEFSVDIPKNYFCNEYVLMLQNIIIDIPKNGKWRYIDVNNGHDCKYRELP